MSCATKLLVYSITILLIISFLFLNALVAAQYDSDKNYVEDGGQNDFTHTSAAGVLLGGLILLGAVAVTALILLIVWKLRGCKPLFTGSNGSHPRRRRHRPAFMRRNLSRSEPGMSVSVISGPEIDLYSRPADARLPVPGLPNPAYVPEGPDLSAVQNWVNARASMYARRYQ